MAGMTEPLPLVLRRLEVMLVMARFVVVACLFFFVCLFFCISVCLEAVADNFLLIFYRYIRAYLLSQSVHSVRTMRSQEASLVPR